MQIKLDYAYQPKQRTWNKTGSIAQILAQLDAGVEDYRKLLSAFSNYQSDFEKIAIRTTPDSTSPSWINGWIPALDSASLYGLLARHNPSVYLEIGSGHSTKFARQAIRDYKLKTKIISIDPAPRAHIDALCDEVIRIPCEDVPPEIFSNLPQDAVAFVDNSHRSFQSSDVTVFFTEILPLLPRGIIWGLHDIFLPEDYPAEWTERYYNEQYLLMAYLLGGSGKDKILLPNFYISKHPELSQACHSLFGDKLFKDVEKQGCCFWMRRS